MRSFKYAFIVVLVVFGFSFVSAKKAKKFKYSVPSNYIVETNFFPAYYPTIYNHTGPEKISIMIPVELKSRLGAPKTKKGELNPEFIKGKQSFNQTVGIENWRMSSYKFTNTPHGERLELIGSYTNFSGVQTTFIEHHYFGSAEVQSIHMYYPSVSEGKAVEQAKLSLQTFSPSFN